MKKLLFTLAFIISLQAVHSQTTTVPSNDTTVVPVQPTPPKKQWNKVDLSNRSNDHLMIQFGLDGWSGAIPDSAKPEGLSRHLNMYVMLDKPFKTNPRFSVGLGVGIGTSNMFFKRRQIDIKSQAQQLPFSKRDSTSHFKKYKLATGYVEVPVELRYTSDPENSNKSWKGALGVKVGQLIAAHTKGKNLEDKNGNSINNYTAKESSKKFFNSTRLAVTGRFGYGVVSIYGAYQITALLKDGTGPIIRPYSIGLTISGL
jgi:hypothetical protein